MKMQDEGRKILHNPNLKISCTCIRVPVMRSHSISLSFRTEKKLSIEEVINAIQNSKGVRLVELPMPLTTGDQDRSEEHTSELQSRQYLVCRLLLEKKKQH